MIVDDGKWSSVMIFALQFYDFASDINLSLEIWFIQNKSDVTYLIAIGSTLFVLIPYIANLVIASRIKRYMVDFLSLRDIIPVVLHP